MALPTEGADINFCPGPLWARRTTPPPDPLESLEDQSPVRHTKSESATSAKHRGLRRLSSRGSFGALERLEMLTSATAEAKTPQKTGVGSKRPSLRRSTTCGTPNMAALSEVAVLFPATPMRRSSTSRPCTMKAATSMPDMKSAMQQGSGGAVLDFDELDEALAKQAPTPKLAQTDLQGAELERASGTSGSSTRGSSTPVQAIGGGGADPLFDFDELSLASTSPSERDLKALAEPETTPPQPSSGGALDEAFDFDALDALDTAVASENPALPALDEAFDFDALDALDTVVAPASPALPALDEAFDFDALDALDTAVASASPAPPALGGGESLARPVGSGVRSASEALRVAMVINGSRGDVQPMLVLAHALQKRKYEVQLLTNANHVEFCEANGVSCTAVFADMHWVIESMGGVTSTWVDGALQGKEAAEQWFRENPSSCISAEDALEDFSPHITICQTTTSGTSLRHEMLFGVPSIPVYLQRSCFECFQDQLVIKPSRPRFFAVSETLDNETHPECENFHQPGEFVFEERLAPEDLAEGGPLAHLKEFLASGEPPVYVGWGSMIAQGLPPEEMLRLALRAVHAVGKRAVILGGWARLDVVGKKFAQQKGLKSDEDRKLAEFARTRVCFAPAAPHAWLLPQCCAAVHHGGVGTTQAVLRAGLPSVITPIFSDQFDNSRRIEILGAGVGLQDPLPQVSWQQLAFAIGKCLSKKAMRVEARKMAFQLDGESGVHHAARVVDEFVKREVVTGEWKARFAEYRGAPLGRQVSS